MTVAALQMRLQFMEIDKDQRLVLQAAKPLIERNIGPALDRFYARARVTPETASLFKNEMHMKTAHAAQVKHWMRIVEARFDEAYYESIRRIGSVHAKIGLEPQWYIGSYALILEEIIEAVDRECSLIKRITAGEPSRGKMTAALMKAALLDMELSVSIYFEEAAAERNQAIAKLDDALARLATGNLAEEISDMPSGFSSLEISYNQTLANLRQTIGSVVLASGTIQSNSREIAESSDQLARRMESNAAALEETAAALVQIENRVKTTAEGAKETLSIADEALSSMETGKDGALKAVETMNFVHESAQGIDEVIEGVDKIAFQTRVLAMNAAIEAGRAGEAGRGFAVVADLVSKLAIRAEEEAQKARQGLSQTKADISLATEAVQGVNLALQAVANKYERVHMLIGQMSEDNLAQSQAITEINIAVSSMDQSTQHNAIMIDRASMSAKKLHEDALRLADNSSRFEVGKLAA